MKLHIATLGDTYTLAENSNGFPKGTEVRVVSWMNTHKMTPFILEFDPKGAKKQLEVDISIRLKDEKGVEHRFYGLDALRHYE